jgi:hypothetical protein
VADAKPTFSSPDEYPMTDLSQRIERRRPRAVRAAICALSLVGVVAAASPALADDPADDLVNNTFSNSGNSGSGIGQFNQNAGDNNNQANATVIALAPNDNSAALARLIGSSINLGTTTSTKRTLQQNAISDAFNDFTGIAQINQVSGNGNVQVNAIALAFAPGAQFSATALSDLDLSLVQSPDGDEPSSALPDSSDHITHSFDGFTGIAQVQQVAGDRNIVTNVVAVAFGTGPL